MEKETLTVKNIQQDLYSILIMSLLRIPAVLLLFALMYWPLSSLLKSSTMLSFILNAYMIFLFAACLWTSFQAVSVFLKIKKFKVELCTARLTGKTESRPGSKTWRSYKPYSLSFDNYSKCEIFPKTHYKWSTSHRMNERQIFNYSNLGDEFLLVSITKKRVAIAYNLSFFDFENCDKIGKSTKNQSGEGSEEHTERTE